ncbi:MAG: hypothetical protein A2284_07440 [Deltaproteobacteria bacterium RIFOXYA12_FULL_61_11]|nr:MAG: hypothetical protein A2284_07440 [Deltaproteobacteria bacterium RIFOXYA12_FULL_61_11]
MIPVSRIMTHAPLTVREDDDMYVVERLMRTAKVRHLPVTQDGRVIGLITHRDLLAVSVSLLADISREEHDEMMRKVPVSEIMNRDVLVIEEDTSIEAACKQLLEHKIGCLPVVKDNKLVGIVTESDMVRLTYQYFQYRNRKD